MHKLLSAYNEYPDITKEFTGPKHFVITRVHCIYLLIIAYTKDLVSDQHTLAVSPTDLLIRTNLEL